MPIIKPSSALRNSYGAISKQCHELDEPVFITVNGKGDLAIQSIESYENLCGQLELYKKISEGVLDIQNGKTMPFDKVISQLQATNNEL